MDAWRHWHEIGDDPVRLRGLLYDRIRKRVIDIYRSKSKSRRKDGPVQVDPADLDFLPEQPDSSQGEDIVVAGITAEIMWKKIAAAADSRKALAAWLHWDQDWTEQQIADQLGVSRATVHYDIEHVRNIALEQLADDNSIAGNPGENE